MNIIEELMLDLDDTIIRCRHNYFWADWICGRIIAGELGLAAPPPHVILELAKRIEREAMTEHGYLFTQFEDAWVETYRQLVEKYGIRFRSEVAAQIFYEAAYVKRADYPVFPETHEILCELKTLVRKIHLVSLGDTEFQMERKVRANGLEPLFDSIHITQLSKSLVMQVLMENQPNIAMAGDNQHTDTDQALLLDLPSIWLHNRSLWTQSENGLDPRTHVIDRLTDLPNKIREINRSARRHAT